MVEDLKLLANHPSQEHSLLDIITEHLSVNENNVIAKALNGVFFVKIWTINLELEKYNSTCFGPRKEQVATRRHISLDSMSITLMDGEQLCKKGFEVEFIDS